MIKKIVLLSLIICYANNMFGQKIIDTIRAKNYDEVKTMLEKGAKPNKYGKKGLFPLWVACAENDTGYDAAYKP